MSSSIQRWLVCILAIFARVSVEQQCSQQQPCSCTFSGITTTAAAPNCVVGAVDLVFVLDQSGSIGLPNYCQCLQFIAIMTQSLSIGPTVADSHVGFVVFDDTATISFYLDSYLNNSAVYDAVRRVTYTGYENDIAAGMTKAINEVFVANRGDRPSVPNIMIVITDGQDTSDVAAAHQLSLTKNITTYALGVGSGVDQAQMAQLTGDPTKVYNVTDFSAVGAILNNICVNIESSIAPPQTTAVASTIMPINGTDLTRLCGCTASTVWLDIVLLIDTSLGMSLEGLNQIRSQLKGIFGGATNGAIQIGGSDLRTSRLAIVNFAANAVIYKNFVDINSTADLLSAIDGIPFLGSASDINLYDALEKANDLFDRTDPRANAKNVVLLCASSYAVGANDPTVAAAQLKNKGVAIITIAYRSTLLSSIPDLSSLASLGYNLTNNDTSLNVDLLTKFCDANCFCPESWLQFVVNSTVSVRKYGECVQWNGQLATWINARTQCMTIDGHNDSYLASVFNRDKSLFLTTQAIAILQAQPLYWIGLHEVDAQYVWDIGTASSLPISYSEWYVDGGYPNDYNGTRQCIANVVPNGGFVVKWVNFVCNQFFNAAYYSFCQINACDTDNYCP